MMKPKHLWCLPVVGFLVLSCLHWAGVVHVSVAWVEEAPPVHVLDFAAHVTAQENPHFIEAQLSGRFANSFIVFSILHRLAKRLGVQIAFGDYERKVFAAYPNIIRDTRDAAIVPKALKRRLAPKIGCNKFLQSYDLMKGMRHELQVLLQPDTSILKAAQQIQQSSGDVVIHFRHFEGPSTLDNAHVTFRYFDTVLSRMHAQRRLGRVLIMTEESLFTHSTVTRLREKYSVELMPPDLHLQIYLARRAGSFVGSLGTLSYILALATNATDVHLPYYSSHREGCSWTPLNDLFIYDDARVSYHDLATNRSFQSTFEVIGNQTTFAHGFLSRKQCLWDLFSFT